MDTGAFDAMLLMTSLSGMKNPERLRTSYVEGLGGLFPGHVFRWAGEDARDGSIRFDVCTRSGKYGSLACERPEAMDRSTQAVIHNSAQMLAVLLEKLDQEAALLEKSRRFEQIALERAELMDRLEERVRERTSDLLEANRSLDESRRRLEEMNSELEARVERRTAEIQRSRASMEAFSYSVSHDLRAPLRAIDGFARILKADHGDSLPAEAVSMVDRIVAGAARMAKLIDAFLVLAQVERRDPVRRRVDPAKIVREVVEEARAASGGMDVHVAVDDLPEADTDPDLARQVFANILGNAFKFSRVAVDPLVQVGSTRRDDGIWYEVRDNGPGFDPSQAGGLFQAFHRLHGGSVEGIGIGLATVRKILDRLGGEIEVEARPGAGAAFRFRLEPVRGDPGADRGRDSTVSC